MRLGPMEIMLILVVVLLVFGVGKLPQVGKSVGEALRGFREASEGKDEPKTQTSESVAAAETPKMSEQELAEFKKWQELKAKANDST